MAFDPSVIGSIGDSQPDFAAAKQKAYTLADAMDQNQLRKMQLSSEKQKASDTAAVRNILKNADLSTYEGQTKAAAAATKVSPAMGMELMKGFQSQKKEETELTVQQYELMAAKNDVIGNASLQLKLKHDELARQGKNEAEINAAMMPDMTNTVQGLLQAKLPDGSPVLNDQDKQNLQQMLGNGYNPQAVDAVVMRSKQAKQVLDQKLAERKTDVAEQHQIETERHNQKMEEQGQQKVDLSKVRLERTSTGGLTDKSAQMLAEQVAAGDTTALQGLKPADKVHVRNVMADNAEIAGTTGADQAAKNAEYKGIQAGERTLGQRQANIDMAVQEAQNIMPILREASKKVPRGKFTSWNKLFQIADGQESDPELLQFAQAAKSFANIYTRATVPGASSVFDREEAVKHLPIFTSDESFQKVLDIMDKEMQAAKASPHQVRQDLSNSVTGSDRTTLPNTQPTPAAGAHPAAPPQGAAPAAGGGPKPGQIIKHPSGATIEILP